MKKFISRVSVYTAQICLFFLMRLVKHQWLQSNRKAPCRQAVASDGTMGF